MQSLGSEPLQFVPIVTVRFHYGVVACIACTQDATPPTGAALTPGFLQDLAYRSMELQAQATCDVTLVVLRVKPCDAMSCAGPAGGGQRWQCS